MGVEYQQGTKVGRHCVVGKEAGDDLAEPGPLFGKRTMHPGAQFLLDLLELCRHAVGSGLPVNQEGAATGFAADEGEAEESEGLRFVEPEPLSVGRRMAAEFQQSGLLRKERERKLLQPVAHGIPEASGVVFVLEAGDQVVGIAHDDHVAPSLTPSPAFNPEIEDVVQVNVGKERRDGSLNTKDNFRFERIIVAWRSGFVLDLRRKR
jgi:hypothetical protein